MRMGRPDHRAGVDAGGHSRDPTVAPAPLWAPACSGRCPPAEGPQQGQGEWPEGRDRVQRPAPVLGTVGGGAAKTLRRLWCAPIPSGGTGGGGWGYTATVLCLRGRPVDPGLHRGRSTHRQSSRGPDAPTPAVGLTSTWQLCPTLQPGLAPPRALLLPQRSLGGPQEANGSPKGRAHPPFTGETEAQLGGVTHHGHWPVLGATRRRAGWGPWHWPGRRPRGPCAALTVRAS